MFMQTLLDYSPDTVEFIGRKYRVNTAYDTILLLQRLYREDILDAGEKIAQALRMIVKSRFKVWLLTDVEKAELLETITKEKIQLPSRPQIGPPRKLMDFEVDGEYIYASFRQAYGMDLVQERGKLSWRRFCELLDSLPEKTKLREVMRIRAMDVPDPTRYNQKERKNIMDLKAYYALPISGVGGQAGLDALFSTLESVAIKGR